MPDTVTSSPFTANVAVSCTSGCQSACAGAGTNQNHVTTEPHSAANPIHRTARTRTYLGSGPTASATHASAHAAPMDHVMADGPSGANPIAKVHHAVSNSHKTPSGVRHAVPTTWWMMRCRTGGVTGSGGGSGKLEFMTLWKKWSFDRAGRLQPALRLPVHSMSSLAHCRWRRPRRTPPRSLPVCRTPPR